MHSTCSTSLYYISLIFVLGNADDQYRNPNMNNKDHLAGQLTRMVCGFSPNLDAVLDGQMVQLVGHFQLEQVVHCEEVEHPSVHPGKVQKMRSRKYLLEAHLASKKASLY